MRPKHRSLMEKNRKYLGRTVKIKLINGYTLIGKITKIKSGGIYIVPLRKKNRNSRIMTSFFFFPVFIPFAAILFIKFIIF